LGPETGGAAAEHQLAEAVRGQDDGVPEEEGGKR